MVGGFVMYIVERRARLNRVDLDGDRRMADPWMQADLLVGDLWDGDLLKGDLWLSEQTLSLRDLTRPVRLHLLAG